MNLVAAAITAGPRWRRAFGVTLSFVTMLAALDVPREHTLLRPFWVLFAFAGFMRTVDLARGPWPLAERLVHVTSLVDTRRLTRVQPFVDLAALFQCVAWQIPALAAYYGMATLARPERAAAWVLRWSLGLVFVYTLSAGAYRLVAFLYGAAGFRTPRLHIAPAKARSVQEFWGERWNRTVSLWLRDTFFRPFARRRHPMLGALAAFFASALLHAYLAWIGVGSVMAMWMLAFFVAQALIVLLERAVAVRRWARWAGHAWTIMWLVGLSPLFDEPLARVLGV